MRPRALYNFSPCGPFSPEPSDSLGSPVVRFQVFFHDHLFLLLYLLVLFDPEILVYLLFLLLLLHPLLHVVSSVEHRANLTRITLRLPEILCIQYYLFLLLDRRSFSTRITFVTRWSIKTRITFKTIITNKTFRSSFSRSTFTTVRSSFTGFSFFPGSPTFPFIPACTIKSFWALHHLEYLDFLFDHLLELLVLIVPMKLLMFFQLMKHPLQMLHFYQLQQIHRYHLNFELNQVHLLFVFCHFLNLLVILKVTPLT